MFVSYRVLAAAGLVLLLGMTGCRSNDHVAKPAVARQLVTHQAAVDQDGLDPAKPIGPLKVSGCLPENWHAMPLMKNVLFTHQQWRSPTLATGIGVAYIRMPLPLPAKTLAYFAKNEYTKREDSGQILEEWTDRFGRHWFEAENPKYHVLGYVLVSGFDAWIIYTGYRLAMPTDSAEISQAKRCMETMLPTHVGRIAEAAGGELPRTASVE